MSRQSVDAPGSVRFFRPAGMSRDIFPLEKIVRNGSSAKAVDLFAVPDKNVIFIGKGIGTRYSDDRPCGNV